MMHFVQSVKLAVLSVFLSASAASQEPAAIRVGIPTVAISVEKVPSADAQAQLLKLLNEIRREKKNAASIEPIELKASSRSEAFTEARKNACQFVLFAVIEEAVPKVRRFREPPKVIRVGYAIARVETSADYAVGSAEAPLSRSPESAMEKAEKRAVQNITMELSGKGSAPLAEPPSTATLSARTEPENNASEEKPQPSSDEPVPMQDEQGKELAKLAGIDPPSPTASPAPAATSTPPTSAAELCSWIAGNIAHAESLSGVCEFALALQQRMPNFICDETASRFREGTRYPLDRISGSLRYEDGKESFSDVKFNGKTAPPAVLNQLSGLWSSGEFGSNLRSIFDPTNRPAFTLLGERKMNKRPAWAFSYRIAEQRDPLWWLTSDDQRIAPPYSGEVWVDEKTGELVLLRLTAEGIPKKFPTQSVETFTAYDNVSFGDGTAFVLPVQSVVKTKYHGELTVNVLEFRNCHKFRAKSRMLLDVPEPKHP
jgi:hypothetical protein